MFNCVVQDEYIYSTFTVTSTLEPMPYFWRVHKDWPCVSQRKITFKNTSCYGMLQRLLDLTDSLQCHKSTRYCGRHGVRIWVGFIWFSTGIINVNACVGDVCEHWWILFRWRGLVWVCFVLILPLVFKMQNAEIVTTLLMNSFHAFFFLLSWSA
jgi:hypothetical protein